MTVISPQLLTKVSEYLKVPSGEIRKQGNIFIRQNASQSATGIINIIFAMLKETKTHLEEIEEALIYQWLEYGLVYVVNANSNQAVQELLKELNNLLSTKTFLVGQKLTIADIFLYHLLFNIMASLSNIDKERFLNVSRWFDNLQQDPILRQKNNIIDFSTNYLNYVAPSKH